MAFSLRCLVNVSEKKLSVPRSALHVYAVSINYKSSVNYGCVFIRPLCIKSSINSASFNKSTFVSKVKFRLATFRRFSLKNSIPG